MNDCPGTHVVGVLAEDEANCSKWSFKPVDSNLNLGYHSGSNTESSSFILNRLKHWEIEVLNYMITNDDGSSLFQFIYDDARYVWSYPNSLFQLVAIARTMVFGVLMVTMYTWQVRSVFTQPGCVMEKLIARTARMSSAVGLLYFKDVTEYDHWST